MQEELESKYGLLIAQVLASNRKLKAGLRYAASGKHQSYPSGCLELGIALDALDMFSNDMLRLLTQEDCEKPYVANPLLTTVV
jgi:hypothetical protein